MRYESVTRPRGPQACGRPVCNDLFPSFQAAARAPVLGRASARGRRCTRANLLNMSYLGWSYIPQKCSDEVCWFGVCGIFV